MPTQITHAANKVTYKWTFNQDVQGGTFWDGSPYIINTNGLKLLNVEMITEHGTEGPNRVISDIELGYNKKVGFKGELYINGLMKNPQGMIDNSPTGQQRDKNYAFDSRSFSVFDRGWLSFRQVVDPVTKKRVKIPRPTNQDSSYASFNLNKFLEVKSQLESGGIDVTTGDVLVVQWSNFNINSPSAWNVNRAQGYCYQRITSRSCCLSYGTLFVLNAHPTEVSFRPPVVWPENLTATRPIFAVSAITSRLPEVGELVQNPTTKQKVTNYSNDPSFKTFCYGMPFGNGTNYSQALPLYSGSIDGTISAYGAYYINPLMSRLMTLYSTETQALPGSQRLQNLKVIVQWGIDAYGSIKSYASTSSGAGQKPCSARPWSVIAGYFLGVTAMRQPETTMIADTARLNGLLLNSGGQIESDEGDSETEIPSNEKMIDLYGNPYAAGDEGTAAKKRWLALRTSLEAICYYKIVDRPGSVLDYRTLGSTHRRTFSGIGANLQQTDPNLEFALPGDRFRAGISTFKGTMAKIQWNTVPEDLKTRWAGTHDGKSTTFWYTYIKVTSGPGAGDTLYRIIKSWGNFRQAIPDNETNATGYGFILDKPWQHGQPDQSSTFEMITCTDKNVGEVFYLIGPTRFKTMADANLSPHTVYGEICEPSVTILYGWMNYIEREKLNGINPDLDKGSVLTHDYVQKIVNSSPYKWSNYSTSGDYIGSRPWQAAILNKWYNKPTSRAGQAATIDWRTLQGVEYWHGITTDDYRDISLPGDFNNDDAVNNADIQMFANQLVTGEYGVTYDLNNDGVVDITDLKILVNDYYGKTQ